MKVLKWILAAIGGLVVAASLYLLIVAVVPGFEVAEQRFPKTRQRVHAFAEGSSISRKEVSFRVKGTEMRAWLYLPTDVSGRLPCIVMAAGLGGTKEMGEGYALRFQEAGFAVLSFDYRYFGQSRGAPRQLVRIPYQLEDWAGAVEYARGLSVIDPARIGLWGTSLSGGHVIVTAARDRTIACVVAQCPGVDGRASAELSFDTLPIGYNLRMLMHGQRDLVRSWLGLPPHKVPIVGKPGSIALMTASDAYEAFARLAPDGFVNEACARIIIRGDKYRPVQSARDVRCPVLLQICEKDQLVPARSIEETGKILGRRAETKRYPIGHFDVYFGVNFERSVNDQTAFFKNHLLTTHAVKTASPRIPILTK